MNKYWIEIDGYRYDLTKKWKPMRVTYEDEFNELGRHRIKNKKTEPAVFEFEPYSTKDKPTLEYILKRFSSFKCVGENEFAPLTFMYERPYEFDGNKVKFYNGDFTR